MMLDTGQSSGKQTKENTTTDTTTKTTTANIKTTGKLINNREDTVKLINEICRWYKEHEPTHPIIIALEKTSGMVGKGCSEAASIIADINIEFSDLTNKVSVIDNRNKAKTNSTSQSDKIENDNISDESNNSGMSASAK